MKEMIAGWRHVFKLDPDRSISDEDLHLLCLSGTDAIMVGGSSGITCHNTGELMRRIRKYALPVVLEVSDHKAIVTGFDLYFIPVVLNTSRAEWVVGNHQQAVKEYGAILPWGKLVAEGYVILNRQSTAAELTGARTELDLLDVISYAVLAEKLFHFPIFYIEYSGRFGDMELIRQVASTLEESRLFYGGGINSKEKAIQASQAAHTIVVGNIIYDDLRLALETVKAKFRE